MCSIVKLIIFEVADQMEADNASGLINAEQLRKLADQVSTGLFARLHVHKEAAASN